MVLVCTPATGQVGRESLGPCGEHATGFKEEGFCGMPWLATGQDAPLSQAQLLLRNGEASLLLSHAVYPEISEWDDSPAEGTRLAVPVAGGCHSASSLV